MQTSVPADDRIVLLRNRDGGGPARSRQLGIDAASGSVIALLDDDDVWSPTKLARQLAAADSVDSDHWIVSSRMLVLGPGSPADGCGRGGSSNRESRWPSICFVSTDSGSATPTCRPPRCAFRPILAVASAGTALSDEPHDEPSWLIRVQRTIPDLRVIQLPDVLSIYNVARPVRVARHRPTAPTPTSSGDLQYLGTESPRVLGDYLCTSPVSAAVSARSLGGVRRAVWSAVRHGRPGPFALAYAVLNAARIIVRTAVSAIRR